MNLKVRTCSNLGDFFASSSGRSSRTLWSSAGRSGAATVGDVALIGGVAAAGLLSASHFERSVPPGFETALRLCVGGLGGTPFSRGEAAGAPALSFSSLPPFKFLTMPLNKPLAFPAASAAFSEALLIA